MPDRRPPARGGAALPGALVAAALCGLAAGPVAAQEQAAAPVAAQEQTADGPLRFEAETGVRFTVGDGRRFVETVELRASGDGALLVNELGMESYVAGIAEMPTRWHLEALKSQAVAARTYGWYSIERGAFDGYDICATVACQVFRGADAVLDSSTGDRWLEAVRETAGEVLVDDNGAPILARYFSTSGGRTYANEDVFPESGAHRYLVAVDDPYDAASPYHRWTARFGRDDFDQILSRGDTLAAAVPVAAVERLGAVDDPAADVLVTGDDGTEVTVSARDLREFVSRIAPSSFPGRYPGMSDDGARPLPATVPSSRFDVEVKDDEVVLHGRGWGHGVGLGQYGALGRALDGATYDEILATYYNGLEPTVSDDLPDRVRVGLDVEAEVTVGGDGWFRIVAGGEELTGRALGTWTARRDGEDWVVTPPDGHGDDLEVTATRVVTDVDVGDAVTVETEVNKPVLLRLEVHDDSGSVVLVRELGAADPGAHAATWRFQDGDGEPVGAGDYRVALVAEDATGAVDGSPVTVPVEDPPPQAGSDSRDRAETAQLLALAAAIALPVALLLALVATRRRRP